MNAARDLARVLTEWNTNVRKTVLVRRGAQEGIEVDYDFWQKQRRCVELIVETEESLDRLRERGIPVDIYRPLLTRIWNYAFSPSVSWQTVQAGHMISVEDIQHLETISHLLEALGESEPNLTDEARGSLLELLDDIVLEVEGCFDLPQSIRTRLATHIQLLRDALDPTQDVDPRKLRRLLDQMAGVMLSAMYETSDPQRKRKLFAWSVSLASAMSQNGAYDGVKAIAGAGIKKLLGIETSD